LVVLSTLFTSVVDSNELSNCIALKRTL